MDRGLRVTGSVLENETGTPEFARVSREITESLAKRGQATLRDWKRPLHEMTPGERWTLRYLEAFDARYQPELTAEAARFAEAMQVSDLNLPYSVSRAIIEEAFPPLIAVSVFDFDLVANSPVNIFFEQYADETGAAGTVTGETVTLTALGTDYSLAKKRVAFGSVTVTDSGDTTTYTEGTDYRIDYIAGTIRGLSGGAISPGDTVKVDYDWVATREGEMQPIHKGKQQLTSTTLTLAADRLLAQVSREAIVFSRTQLGYDAVSRAVAGLVGRSQRVIDGGAFSVAVNAALSVANNSGGTWSHTIPGDTTYDEHLDVLIRYVGAARTKVYNRHYTPDSVTCSMATADTLANSNHFTAAGERPDMDLNAAGFVGRLKGLPVFAPPTEQFPDEYILVANRELVFHRVLESAPMTVKGPYHITNGDGDLLAGEQYYTEEFNGTIAPVPGKGAYVRLTS
jgi:hypothetical protein